VAPKVSAVQHDEAEMLVQAWDRLVAEHGDGGAAWRLALLARVMLTEAVGERAARRAWKDAERGAKLVRPKVRARKHALEAAGPKRGRGRPRGSVKDVTRLVNDVAVVQSVLAARGEPISRTAAAGIVAEAAHGNAPGVYGESAAGIQRRLIAAARPEMDGAKENPES
jgi:hypothetical protein